MIKVKSKTVIENFSKPKPLSKLFKLIFTVAFFVFSMDFGLLKYKSVKRKIITKIIVLSYTFLVSFIILFVYIPLEDKYLYWYTRYILENFLNILILLTTPKRKSFFKFIEYLHSIDAELGVDSNSYRLDIKILSCWIGSIVYKSLTTIIYCSEFDECLKPIWIQILFTFSCFPLHVPMILSFFIFYAARSRLAILRKFIENRPCEVLYFQFLYKSLIDATETIKAAFVPIFIVNLIGNVPGLLAVIYQIIKEMTHGSKNVTAYLTESFVVMSAFTVMFAPAVASGSLFSEVNKIKINFHNILLEEKDPVQERDLKNCIKYIEARPFKFTLLGIVKLDGTLPMIVLNLSTTYIIILLQLTHLY